MNDPPVIIPVASGKGGVGKSFLAANLAISLAQQGKNVVAIDLDLGASNLHFFLGVPNKYPGIGDFLKLRMSNLDELLLPTMVSNLSFLPGDGKTPFLANITWHEKQKLIRQVAQLEADYLVVDLGAGSTFNTIDLYLMAPRGLLVTAPELPAVLSMLAFLKQILMRCFDRQAKGRFEIRQLINQIATQPMAEESTSVADLLARICTIDSELGQRLEVRCHELRPRIVFNMGMSLDELSVTGSIQNSLRDLLSLEADFFGFVPVSAEVRESISLRTAFLVHSPTHPVSLQIDRIAERIIRYWYDDVADSAHLLERSLLQELVFPGSEGRDEV
jgi:flagellar biosynthesis protein FlhG